MIQLGVCNDPAALVSKQKSLVWAVRQSSQNPGEELSLDSGVIMVITITTESHNGLVGWDLEAHLIPPCPGKDLPLSQVLQTRPTWL